MHLGGSSISQASFDLVEAPPIGGAHSLQSLYISCLQVSCPFGLPSPQEGVTRHSLPLKKLPCSTPVSFVRDRRRGAGRLGGPPLLRASADPVEAPPIGGGLPQPLLRISRTPMDCRCGLPNLHEDVARQPPLLAQGVLILALPAPYPAERADQAHSLCLASVPALPGVGSPA